jgi:hypothetical protein
MADPISGNDHHAHQFQELYHQNLKALVETISAALKKAAEQTIKGAGKAGEALKSGQQALKGDTAKKELPIRLFVSGKEVYSQASGQEPTKNFITSEQFQKIKQALEDPKNLKGAVEIKAGVERIFHAKNGEIKIDSLKLAQSQTQEVKVSQAPLPLQEPQISPEATSTQPESSLTAEITSFKQTVEQQEQRIVALEKKIDTLSQSLSSIQNKSLSRWMGNTLSSTAKGFKQAVAGWAVNKGNAVKNLQQKAQSTLRSAFTTQHPLQKRLQEIENKVQAVNTKFDWGMENIQAHLNAIQQQIKDIQNNPVVQSTTKAVVGKVIEPAVASVLQGTGVMQNFEKLQAKEGLAKLEGTTERVESIPNAYKEFKAGMVVAAAEKLLERIPAQTSEGSRSFQTGSGYLLEKKGDTITISNPERTELVSSKGRGSERQINVSEHLTNQNAVNLERIGEKIHQDLSPLQNQSQSLSMNQGATRRLS